MRAIVLNPLYAWPQSTRPFLSVMEKRWIAFQLLKALEECHAKKVHTHYLHAMIEASSL